MPDWAVQKKSNFRGEEGEEAVGQTICEGLGLDVGPSQTVAFGKEDKGWPSFSCKSYQT